MQFLVRWSRPSILHSSSCKSERKHVQREFDTAQFEKKHQGTMRLIRDALPDAGLGSYGSFSLLRPPKAKTDDVVLKYKSGD